MRSRRNSRNSRLRQNLSIDMTPIMDLTFMLLIVFVITVPVLDYSSDIIPPRMTTDNPVESTSQALMVTLNESGEYHIDGISTPASDLDAAISRMSRSTGKGTVVLRSDHSRPFEEVVAVMRAAKNAGLTMSVMTIAE